MIELYLGNKCNLQCSYCYNKDSPPDSPPKELPRFPITEHIYMMGGEPLLYWDIIKQYKYFSITTNGTLLTPEIVRQVHAHKGQVKISLDGTPGTMLKTRGIVLDEKILKLADSFRMTVTPNTLHNLVLDIEYVKKFGKPFKFVPAFEYPESMWDWDYWKYALKKYKKYGYLSGNCMAGKSLFCYTTEKKQYLCHRLVGIDIDKIDLTQKGCHYINYYKLNRVYNKYVGVLHESKRT